MRDVLMLCSLIAGLLSAFFWIRSARAKVVAPPEFQGKKDGLYHAGIVLSGGADLVASLHAQSVWNSRAAYTAAAAAFLQAMLAYWPAA